MKIQFTESQASQWIVSFGLSSDGKEGGSDGKEGSSDGKEGFASFVPTPRIDTFFVF